MKNHSWWLKCMEHRECWCCQSHRARRGPLLGSETRRCRHCQHHSNCPLGLRISRLCRLSQGYRRRCTFVSRTPRCRPTAHTHRPHSKLPEPRWQAMLFPMRTAPPPAGDYFASLPAGYVLPCPLSKRYPSHRFFHPRAFRRRIVYATAGPVQPTWGRT